MVRDTTVPHLVFMKTMANYDEVYKTLVKMGIKAAFVDDLESLSQLRKDFGASMDWSHG